MKPDKLEYAVRFLCGAVLGALLGVGGVLRLEHGTAGGYLLLVVVLPLAFGLLAAVLGDRFWHSLPWWLRVPRR